MKIADYDDPTPQALRIHRIASGIVFPTLAFVEWHFWLYCDIRLIAAQFIATVIIWFVDGDYYDKLLRRTLNYRTAAWIFLVGSPFFMHAVILATAAFLSH